MCGIAGMIDLTAARRTAPGGAVERMARAILHRGPDDDGFLPRPGLHLANRRLSIVGLKDGKQPIANEDESVWTVFNGELYDYAQSRKLLESRGHVFRTSTDTELIPHLWEEYRERFLDHVKGQFAICVWDASTNEFLLARDRSGICPLFHTVVAPRRRRVAAVRLGDQGAVGERVRRRQDRRAGAEPCVYVLRHAGAAHGLRGNSEHPAGRVLALPPPAPARRRRCSSARPTGASPTPTAATSSTARMKRRSSPGSRKPWRPRCAGG